MEQLWEHQREGALRASREHLGYGLFFEQGCGKTRTLIEILRSLYTCNGQMLRTLILCPKIVVSNWKREILKYSKITDDNVILLQGTGPKRLELFRSKAFFKFATDYPVSRIMVTNYEGLLMESLFKNIETWQPQVIVCDESHKLKDHSTKRTKLVIKLSEKANKRYLLSGTPILNSATDIFSQFLILDGGESFGKNFFGFRATYFYDKNKNMPRHNYFPNWVPQADAFERMNKLINEKSMRVMKKDCLDLPPLVRQRVDSELSHKQKQAYEAMYKDCIAFLDGDVVMAQLALTKFLRLQQIVSGYYQPVDGEAVHFEENPRLAVLKELLADLTPNHKVIVWACFRENYKMIRSVCADLSIQAVEVHGEVGDRDRDKAISAFDSDDNVRVLIGHPGSGGIGINLVAASYAIFYSRSFSLEHDLQAEARNHRGGSEIHEKITRIDIVTPGTIDEIVTERLAQKMGMGEELLKVLKDEAKVNAFK